MTSQCATGRESMHWEQKNIVAKKWKGIHKRGACRNGFRWGITNSCAQKWRQELQKSLKKQKVTRMSPLKCCPSWPESSKRERWGDNIPVCHVPGPNWGDLGGKSSSPTSGSPSLTSGSSDTKHQAALNIQFAFSNSSFLETCKRLASCAVALSIACHGLLQCVGAALKPLCQFRLNFLTWLKMAHKNQLWTYPHCQFAKHVEEHSDPLPGQSLTKSILDHLTAIFQPGSWSLSYGF